MENADEREYQYRGEHQKRSRQKSWCWESWNNQEDIKPRRAKMRIEEERRKKTEKGRSRCNDPEELKTDSSVIPLTTVSGELYLGISYRLSQLSVHFLVL
ncbi:hypothetical protein T03_5113 [Trichinella britovi]|uniref:Uncharacterized protein n=1 Tax=Trichinella britovi TaxID=45882 RepID=A0A0V1CCP2_TRIBR|nr:hypothetical protein T03_5113 [Trichinella britovi]